jgi:dTDP-4-amino-4,6-dideoxygalactose transaminase
MEDPILGEDEFAAVDAALRSGQLSSFSSSEIAAFEEEFATYIGVPDACAVTSGTAALHASLVALNRNSGKVHVPVYTYAATVNAIYLAGHTPDFVDLEPNTSTIGLDGLASRVDERSVAVLGVDLFGIPFDRDRAVRLCASAGVALVEDCAQSVGATWRGQKVGSFGVGCHSFGEIKNMTSAEGGMVTCADAQLLERVRAVRHAGEVWRVSGRSTIGHYESSLDDLVYGIDYVLPGHNYRMNALQAALGRVQLRRLDSLNSRRNEIYAAACLATKDLASVATLRIPEAAGAVANRLCILWAGTSFSRRAALFALMAEGIPAGVYYPLLHSQSSLARGREVSGEGLYPNATRLINQHVLLPCYPTMHDDDVHDVVTAARKVFSAELTEQDRNDLEGRALAARATYFGQFFTLAPPPRPDAS